MCYKNKAIQAGNNLDLNAHTSASYLNMKTLKLEDLYKFNICVVMHYADHDMSSDYLSRRICIHSINHNYDTRNSNLFVLPRYRLSKSQCSVLYFGIKLFNSLLNQYLYFSLSMYENTIKDYFVNQYPNRKRYPLL